MITRTKTTLVSQQIVIRRFLIAALVLPIVYVVVATVLQLSLMPHLPDPVAIHWEADGQPNGFAPAWMSLVLTVVLGLGLPILLTTTTLRALRRGERGITFRFLGAVSNWLSVLVVALTTWSLFMQSGIADAKQSPSITIALIGSFVLACVAGLIAWLVQPATSTVAAPTFDLPKLDVTPREQLAWMRETSVPRIWLILAVLLGVVLIGLTIQTFVASSLLVAAPFVLVNLVVLVLLATSTAFHVRVNERGLSVRSVFGWPVFRVPLVDIHSVAAREIAPFGDFGGYGIRMRPGAFGIVLRNGEGIVVTRRNGREFIVTVDDAATGAAVLSSLVSRAHAQKER